MVGFFSYKQFKNTSIRNYRNSNLVSNSCRQHQLPLNFDSFSANRTLNVIFSVKVCINLERDPTLWPRYQGEFISVPTPSSGLASQMLTQLQDIYYGKEPDHPWSVDIESRGSIQTKSSKQASQPPLISLMIENHWNGTAGQEQLCINNCILKASKPSKWAPKTKSSPHIIHVLHSII